MRIRSSHHLKTVRKVTLHFSTDLFDILAVLSYRLRLTSMLICSDGRLAIRCANLPGSYSATCPEVETLWPSQVKNSCLIRSDSRDKWCHPLHWKEGIILVTASTLSVTRKTHGHGGASSGYPI